MSIKNYGFKEPTIKPKAWIALGATGVPVRPDSIWPTPLYEPQAENFETFGCTIWGLQNQIEMYMIEVFGFEPNFDERYNYNIAEINPPGADPDDSYESARKKGLTQGVLPMTETLEEFKTPRPMIDKYYNEGKKWLEGYKFEHWWLGDTSKEGIIAQLQFCPVGVSVTAWQEEDGVYVDGDRPNSHWCVAFAPAEYKGRKTVKVFDSYDHSIKVLHPDHKISVAKKILITRVTEQEKQLNWIQKIIDYIRQALGLIQIEADKLAPPVPKVEPKKDYIGAMAEGIKEFEVWAGPGETDRTGKIHPKGSLSFRNNNPGNIKNVDGQFIVFSSPEVGWAGLLSYLERACTSKHRAYKPDMSIRQFFSIYAPDGENIESNYASYVCNYMSKKLGETIFPSRQLKTLV